MSTDSATSLNPRLQSILVGVQGRMAERQNTTEADDAPPSPQLHSILAGVQSRHGDENGDGTHEFLTDTDGDGLVDTQQRIDDDTGEELSKSESPDLEDTIKDVWHMVTGFFSD
ncbi:hypothetical protein FRC08_003164 [Ceratobasidium sp. 394]|nr:hypothetical protein FRC08_003164 [Ceratobasidium sp. 394]